MNYRDVRHGDVLAVLSDIPDKSIDHIITDPPYFRAIKEDWDAKQWPTLEDFLSWLNSVLAEFARVMKYNGTFAIFCSTANAWHVESVVRKHFSVVNHVVWVKGVLPGKPDTQQARTERSKARAFAPSGERLIIAESPRSQSSVVAAEDKLRARVFRPVIDYLISEHSRSGVSASDIIKWHAARGLPKYSTARHVLSANSQWAFPTAEAYSHLRDCLNDLGDGSYLDREYEGLRREYEGLRRPFDIEQTSMWSDCWHFPPTPAQPGRHPCEKPLALMEHIIATTTRPTDVVLDAFCGSGSTGAACVGLGRQFIGIERDSRWVDYAQDRIDAAVAQQRLFA